MHSVDLLSNPFEQFHIWFEEAKNDPHIQEANACFLATATKTGMPSIRTVLMKDFNQMGLVFFTNYLSRKGQELSENPQASILFYWPSLYRQIRLEGLVEKIHVEASDAYFASRPRGSQLSAYVSPQSQIISDRQTLERKLAEADLLFKDKPIPRPPHWGGFQLKPHYFEFWIGQNHRFHERHVYTWKQNQWLKTHLAP